MEARAAVSLVTSVFESGDDCLAHLVTNDDSSTCSNCKHPLKELVATGRMQKSDWPKTKGSANVSDKGKLPLFVRAIDSYFADPSHRIKSVGRGMYAIVCELGRKLKFTNVDCEQIKRNMGFWHRQNIDEEFEVFKGCFLAVIEHHYGDHNWCVGVEEGGWCQYKNN